MANGSRSSGWIEIAVRPDDTDGSDHSPAAGPFDGVGGPAGGGETVPIGALLTSDNGPPHDDDTPTLLLRDRVRSAVPVPETLAEARRLLFAPPPGPPVGLASEWLRPEADIVARQPRPEIDDLLTWCRLPDRSAVLRLLYGAGGQGKTYAAQQICATLAAEGWLAGFVALPPATWRTTGPAELELTGADRPQWEDRLRRAPELIAGIRAVAHLQTPTLLVIDQAEYVGPLIAELLGTIAEYDAQPWVRVLLLARSPDGWFSDLSEAHRLRSWVARTPTWLPPLPQQLGAEQARAVWRHAVASFAQRAVSDGVLPVLDLGRLTTPEPAGLWETTLDFYADAALRVLDATAPTFRRHTRRDGGGPDPVAGVLAYERRQVSAVLAAAGCEVEEEQRDWAIAVVSLRPAAGPQSALAALDSVPAPWQVAPDHRAEVAVALGRLYRGQAGQGWAPPVPNRLADAHLLDLAGSRTDPEWSAVLASICGSADPLAALHAATTLIRCLSAPTPSRRQERAKNRISASLPRLLRAAPSQYAVPFTLLAPEPFTEAITDLLVSGEDRSMPVATARQLDSLVLSIGYTPSRAPIAAAISDRLVAAARPGPDADEEKLSEYARCLNNLGIRLLAVGREEEALEPAEEAAAVQRRLALHDPARYLPDLATSLDILGSTLADAGRPLDAVAPAEEAVAVYRRLVAFDSGTYLPDLAAALNTLGARLTAVGRRMEAIEPIEEAVAVCRRLAVVNRAAYQPDLAFSLGNLSSGLAELARWEDALAPAEEAVSVYRQLAAVNVGVHLPALALALNSLGNQLAAAGRREDALVPAEEAVAVYRRLAATNSPVHLPNLAASLNNLGIRLAEAGRQQEALTPVEEAVAGYRRLAEANADAYLPELALSLHNLGNRLNRLDRPEEALTPVEEAITLRRDLAETDPSQHSADLARSLAAASVAMTAVGRTDAAVAAATEAVELLEAAPVREEALLRAVLRIRTEALAAIGQSSPVPARPQF